MHDERDGPVVELPPGAVADRDIAERSPALERELGHGRDRLRGDQAGIARVGGVGESSGRRDGDCGRAQRSARARQRAKGGPKRTSGSCHANCKARSARLRRGSGAESSSACLIVVVADGATSGSSSRASFRGWLCESYCCNCAPQRRDSSCSPGASLLASPLLIVRLAWLGCAGVATSVGRRLLSLKRSCARRQSAWPCGHRPRVACPAQAALRFVSSSASSRFLLVPPFPCSSLSRTTQNRFLCARPDCDASTVFSRSPRALVLFCLEETR